MFFSPQLFTLFKYPSINKANSFIFFTIMGLTICGHHNRSRANLHYLPDKNNSIHAFGIFLNVTECSTTLFEVIIDLCPNTTIRNPRCWRVAGPGESLQWVVLSGGSCLSECTLQSPHSCQLLFWLLYNMVTSSKEKRSHTVCGSVYQNCQLLLAKTNKQFPSSNNS